MYNMLPNTLRVLVISKHLLQGLANPEHHHHHQNSLVQTASAGLQPFGLVHDVKRSTAVVYLCTRLPPLSYKCPQINPVPGYYIARVCM